MFGIGQKWYWITAKINGRDTLIYPPYPTKQKAMEEAFKKLSGVLCDVFESDTKDQGKATQQYRMKIVDGSEDKAEGLGRSIRPMRHKFPDR